MLTTKELTISVCHPALPCRVYHAYGTESTLTRLTATLQSGAFYVDSSVKLFIDWNNNGVPKRMTHIAGTGIHGTLVLLGGTPDSSLQDSREEGTGSLVSLDVIAIFDISSVYNSNAQGRWYKQNASGPIPEPRMDFCLVSVSAADNSSHQIYLYGGRGKDGLFFDEVWVLSLPSFTWTLLFTGESPRAFHTCYIAGDSQMITIGGRNDTDFLRGDDDGKTMGVAIFDLNSGVWGSVYNASAGSYQVPRSIRQVIGGG